MADLRERKAESKLMRYCKHTGCVYDVKEDCPAPWCNAERGNHRGRVIRMFVCSCCKSGFFRRADFKAHECHDAY